MDYNTLFSDYGINIDGLVIMFQIVMELFYFPLFLFVLFCCFFFTKKSLKTPSEAVNRKRTDNAKTKNRTDNYLHTKNRD
jgi:hypothetical protein